ncbi:MAG: helix-turn-helix transcriptional regulator [Deltaproteobacteria bacterium]|nr:helix-turn-helix transcriptional regulator [Deltaproteobacteria bacterium]
MTTHTPTGVRPLLRKLDGVELLERIYAPEPDWQRWGMDLIDIVNSAAVRSRLIVLTVVAHGDALASLQPLHIIGGEAASWLASAADAFFQDLDPETVAAAWYPGRPLVTHSELFAHLSPHRREQLARARAGFADCLGAFAYPQPGVIAVVCVLLDEVAALSAIERRHLRRVAAHLEGGVRLRMRPDLAVAAVLRSDGRLLDASGDDVARRRDDLAHQIRRVELARARTARRDPDALEHWRALVDGTYTIVPRAAGPWSTRREYLFVRNGSLARRDAQLGMREAEVVRQVARGLSQKEVAYALGISEGSVSAALERVRVRLGLGSRVELVRVARGALGLVAARVATDTLTQAERAVLTLLREGLTNADIARLRSTSPNTIANQVASILRKTGASGRRALATVLGEGE